MSLTVKCLGYDALTYLATLQRHGTASGIEFRLLVRWLHGLEKVTLVFLSHNGVLCQAKGAAEIVLMLCVMHVKIRGSRGAPVAAFRDYLSQNICILPSEDR